MLTIGIVPNMTKSDCVTALNAFCGELYGRANLYILYDAAFGDALKGVSSAQLLQGDAFFKKCDIITVMGGDGSILQIASQAAKCGKPIFGINLGRVGYLAGAEKSYLKEAAKRLISGEYELR